jgi:hypothetical protein
MAAPSRRAVFRPERLARIYHEPAEATVECRASGRAPASTRNRHRTEGPWFTQGRGRPNR